MVDTVVVEMVQVSRSVPQKWAFRVLRLLNFEVRAPLRVFFFPFRLLIRTVSDTGPRPSQDTGHSWNCLNHLETGTAPSSKQHQNWSELLIMSSSSTTTPSPYSYNPLHRITPIPSSSNQPKLVPPNFKYLIRICGLSLFLTLSILIYQSSSIKSSPWLRSSTPTVFTSPPSALAGMKKSGPLPPVKGCQNVAQTKLEPREKGVILLLVREEDLKELEGTLLNFEAKFNQNFRYPYLFLSTPELSPNFETIPSPGFSTSFRSSIASFLPKTATILYDTVPVSSWSLPSHLNGTEIREGFARMEKEGVQYAGREGYHHMCRFFSGEWVWGEGLREFDWYWRLEPGGKTFFS